MAAKSAWKNIQVPYWSANRKIQLALGAYPGDPKIVTPRPAAAVEALRLGLEAYPAAQNDVEHHRIEVVSCITDNSWILSPDTAALFSPVEWRDYGRESIEYYTLSAPYHWALAAVFSDHRALELLDEYAVTDGIDDPAIRPVSLEYLHVIDVLRGEIEQHGVASVASVRKTLQPPQRKRLTEIWRLLVMKEAYSVEKKHPDHLLYAKRHAAAVRPHPALFRNGQQAVAPVEAQLPPLPRSEPFGTISRSYRSQAIAADLPVQDVVLEKSGAPRRQYVTDSLTVAATTWLTGATGKRPDGTTYVPVELKNAAGETTGNITVDWETWLQPAPSLSAVIGKDRTNTIRAYSDQGVEVVNFDLNGVPELISVVSKRDIYGFSAGVTKMEAQREVDVSPTRELLAMTFLDQAFLYRFDGSVVCGISAPTAADHRDWAYFVQISPTSDTWFIGFYSGVLMHLTFDGVELDRWFFGASVRILMESPDGIRGFAGENFFSLTKTGVQIAPMDLPGRPRRLGTHLVSNTQSELTAIDLRNGSVRKTALPHPLRAVYPTQGGLTIETQRGGHFLATV